LQSTRQPQAKRIVAIPLPSETYDIARLEADEAGLMVGTKIRMDIIAYYNGVAKRQARKSARNGARK